MHRGLHPRGALIGNRRASCGRYTTKFLWKSGLFQLARDFSVVSRLFIQARQGYRERTIVSRTRLQIGESRGSGWPTGWPPLQEKIIGSSIGHLEIVCDIYPRLYHLHRDRARRFDQNARYMPQDVSLDGTISISAI